MRYFVVEYYQQPSGKYNEQVSVHKSVKDNLMSRAMLVLDFRDRKIVKMRVDHGLPRDFDRVANFYASNGYDKIIGSLEEGYRALHAYLEASKKEFEEPPENK